MSNQEQNQTIFWTGRTEKNRTGAIQEIEHCIQEHGFITDFHTFSDLAISLSIETEERYVNALYDSLCAHLHMDAFGGIASSSERSRNIFLNISFSSGKGDLKTEVPAVPG